MSQFNEILTFWFGELDSRGTADELHKKRWFMKDLDFDRTLIERFEATHTAVLGGQCDDWLETPHGRLAYIIVLDQFSRNMFRGTPKMFAADARALEVAKETVALGADRQVAFDERSFFYMPFMHSESLVMQERCVELFRALRDENEGALRDSAAYGLKFAEQHRDIVARFGRFPHRNATLGRTSTGEEIEFLKQPGSSF